MAPLSLVARSSWLLLFAVVTASASPPPLGKTPIGDTPWNPAALAEEKVIYGNDDRLDVYAVSDMNQQALAASVCALLDADDLQNNFDGTYTIQAAAYTVSGLPPCPGEAFANQPVAAFCTGFMVEPTLIATAAHCYFQSDLSNVRFVFGFEMLDATTPQLTVDETQVYTGIEITSRALLGDGTDYCLIRVDREITAPGAFSLPIRRDGEMSANTPLGIIGHPFGLPKKIAFGLNTKLAGDGGAFFTSNLDAYGGNSGSPVFNQLTGTVEGILVRGETDFVTQMGCFSSNVPPDESAGEESTKTTVFAIYVDDFNIPEVPSGTPASQGKLLFILLAALGCAGAAGLAMRDAKPLE